MELPSIHGWIDGDCNLTRIVIYWERPSRIDAKEIPVGKSVTYEFRALNRQPTDLERENSGLIGIALPIKVDQYEIDTDKALINLGGVYPYIAFQVSYTDDLAGRVADEWVWLHDPLGKLLPKEG